MAGASGKSTKITVAFTSPSDFKRSSILGQPPIEVSPRPSDTGNLHVSTEPEATLTRWNLDPPATYLRELLLGPKPFLFFEEALTVTDFPDFRPLMVQVVFCFFMVQDLPPAETLLPVSLDPPFDAGKEMVTLRLILPFFAGIDSMEVTRGAVGRVTLVFAENACDGLVCRVATSDTTKI